MTMKNLLLIIFFFSAIITEGQEIKFNDFMHCNQIGSDHVNSSVTIKVTPDSKINYKFSHTVLTNGKSYDEFVKENNGKFKVSITPRILDQEYVNNSNILILANHGLYLFNTITNELTLLKESSFDSKGKLISYYTKIVDMDGDTIKLISTKVASQRDASDYYATPHTDEERKSALSKLNKEVEVVFVINTTTKTLINL